MARKLENYHKAAKGETPCPRCVHAVLDRGTNRYMCWGEQGIFSPTVGRKMTCDAARDVDEDKCPHCGAVLTCVDICDKCGDDFGESGDDGNGYNCTCVSCRKSNLWTTCCSACREPVD